MSRHLSPHYPAIYHPTHTSPPRLTHLPPAQRNITVTFTVAGRLIDLLRNALGTSLDELEILARYCRTEPGPSAPSLALSPKPAHHQVLDEADRLLELGFKDEVG